MIAKVKELNPDIVFWTGDFPPHEIHRQDFKHTKRYLNYLTESLKEIDSEIVGIMGNHDFATLNS